jgi:hypothetical protein
MAAGENWFLLIKQYTAQLILDEIYNMVKMTKVQQLARY